MKSPYSVPKTLRWAIYIRDGGCLLYKLEPGHVCRDLWNQEHAHNDFDRLTLEHVKDQSMMGKRAPSDEQHMVALCAASNIGVPSRSQREAFRAYLRAVAA